MFRTAVRKSRGRTAGRCSMRHLGNSGVYIQFSEPKGEGERDGAGGNGERLALTSYTIRCSCFAGTLYVMYVQSFLPIPSGNTGNYNRNIPLTPSPFCSHHFNLPMFLYVHPLSLYYTRYFHYMGEYVPRIHTYVCICMYQFIYIYRYGFPLRLFSSYLVKCLLSRYRPRKKRSRRGDGE